MTVVKVYFYASYMGLRGEAAMTGGFVLSIIHGIAGQARNDKKFVFCSQFASFKAHF